MCLTSWQEGTGRSGGRGTGCGARHRSPTFRGTRRGGRGRGHRRPHTGSAPPGRPPGAGCPTGGRRDGCAGSHTSSSPGPARRLDAALCARGRVAPWPLPHPTPGAPTTASHPALPPSESDAEHRSQPTALVPLRPVPGAQEQPQRGQRNRRTARPTPTALQTLKRQTDLCILDA